MREYGSEFAGYPFDNVFQSVFDNKSLFQSCMYFRCGRDSLFYIANHIKTSLRHKDEHKILIPALACESMINPFLKNDFGIEYYHVSKEYGIDSASILEKCNSVDAILIMFYFQYEHLQDLYAKCKQKNKQLLIIEDLTQVILGLDKNLFNTSADYYSASIRKWVGIPNGAIAASPRFEFVETIDYFENEFTTKRKKAGELKLNYLVKKDLADKIRYRHLFESAEMSLDSDFIPKLCDPESLRFIKNMNTAEIAYIRRANFHLIKSELENINGFRVFNLQTCFMLPCLVEGSNRDLIQTKLANRGLYTQVLWPISIEASKLCPHADFISKNMLAIPIDQRYGFEDVQNIVNIIKEISLSVFG